MGNQQGTKVIFIKLWLGTSETIRDILKNIVQFIKEI